MRVRALPALRVRAVAVVTMVLSVLVAPVLAAEPAAAGGPTSVLLSAPSLGRTASLYTTDAAYSALAEQVGAFMAVGSSSAQPTERSSGSHAVGNEVTLTWLIHDVSVWRVDRVYVDAAGGPWIASQEAAGGTGSIWDAPVTWHRSPEPKALVQLLGSLGLLAGTSGAAPGDATTPMAAPAAGQDASARAAGAARGDAAEVFSPALAGLLGLVAGALATALVSFGLSRRSGHQRRWPDLTAPAGDDTPASTDGDVLSSGDALVRG